MLQVQPQITQLSIYRVRSAGLKYIRKGESEEEGERERVAYEERVLLAHAVVWMMMRRRGRCVRDYVLRRVNYAFNPALFRMNRLNHRYHVCFFLLDNNSLTSFFSFCAFVCHQPCARAVLAHAHL